MRLTWRRITIALAGLAALGAAFWSLAPYNVAATVGHLPPVRAILHGYMNNAVGIRAAGLDPPAWFDPRDPALIRLGAGHFATGCATCHGAPGLPRNPVATAMLPEPTPIEETGHTPKEFYWLARHGLKYTGMPAWAGQGRDDEPWALAAFLSRYDTLGPEEYQRLAYGEAMAQPTGAAVAFGGMTGTPDAPVDNCARCHGEDGLGRDGTAPKLAGQSAAYLAGALNAYAEGRRQSGFMEPVAIALPEAVRRDLARHYAEMRPGPWQGRTDGRGDPARGRALALTGDEHGEIPSCVSCHGAGDRPPRTEEVPRIAGQDARWIEVWLRMWRDGPVPDTPEAARMAAAARNLDDGEIADLAAFYAGAAGEQAGE